MGKQAHYLISETARKVKVESHVLRYWEEELEIPIKRNELGHRYYTEEDVQRFREIKNLKEQGLQLKAIRMILKDGKLERLRGDDSLESFIKCQEKAQDGEKKTVEKTAGEKASGAGTAGVKADGKAAANKKAISAGSQTGGNGKAPGVNGQAIADEKDREKRENIRKETASGNGTALRTKGTSTAESKTNLHSKATAAAEDRKEDNRAEADLTFKGAEDGRTEANSKSQNARLEEYAQSGQARHMIEVIGKKELSGVREESREEKSMRLQILLQHMIAEAVRSNNRELCDDIKETVLKEMDYQFRLQEEREDERESERIRKEDEHYRQLDELLRTYSKRGRSSRRSEKRARKEKSTVKTHGKAMESSVMESDTVRNRAERCPSEYCSSAKNAGMKDVGTGEKDGNSGNNVIRSNGIRNSGIRNSETEDNNGIRGSETGNNDTGNIMAESSAVENPATQNAGTAKGKREKKRRFRLARKQAAT